MPCAVEHHACRGKHEAQQRVTDNENFAKSGHWIRSLHTMFSAVPDRGHVFPTGSRARQFLADRAASGTGF